MTNPIDMTEPAVAEWLCRTRYADELDPDKVTTAKRIVASIPAWTEMSRAVLALVLEYGRRCAMESACNAAKGSPESIESIVAKVMS